MQAEDMITDKAADKAHENYNETLLCRARLQAEWLKLGLLLKESRDESLYKFLGYDDFNSYLGAPEFTFHRSTAYKLIAIVELYLDKLHVDEERLIKIGTTNLDAIKGVVESDVEGWLTKAEHLSKSSLNEEIDGQGPGVKSLSPPPLAPAPLTCINGCGPGEKSHFPVTRGAGGQEVEDWWVPMCRECHGLFHADPKAFTWTYKREWARYLYGLINRGE